MCCGWGPGCAECVWKGDGAGFDVCGGCGRFSVKALTEEPVGGLEGRVVRLASEKLTVGEMAEIMEDFAGREVGVMGGVMRILRR